MVETFTANINKNMRCKKGINNLKTSPKANLEQTEHEKTLYRKNLGFTLAEVLITIAIIGVVAALTVPIVISKYQQKQFYTRFMKMYNTLYTAYTLAVAQNGSIIFDDNITPNEFIETYFLPYLKINSAEDLPNYTLKTLDGNVLATFQEAFSRNISAGVCSDKYYNLSDGSAIVLAVYDPGHEATFFVDTNGKAAPNTFGRDIFTLSVVPKYNGRGGYYYAFGAQMKTGNNNNACSAEGNGGSAGIKGIGCADRILKEGAMNY